MIQQRNFSKGQNERMQANASPMNMHWYEGYAIGPEEKLNLELILF